ncbi:Multicopper oxidase abr1 [Penicillium chermesinum]|uniref:Multicopper oxidase abr1 n=1 Tax=Penicillium chermesinum TaxID=63820 RepID=A0A9W9NPD4_9EURO|nr:Multicopper oxidase abr1 [Penicillium chermesinum]KAJ5223687.1 Multicopper oxidase abr1 [Penicillium chermesinum]
MAKLTFLLLAGAATLAAAKDVYLNWNVTWVNAAPDGFERPVIGINGQWPCPQIDVDLGDRLIVDVHNGLGNQSTGVHWHGIHQYATGVMDGASGVTQCPIPPGEHMQYHFEVNQTGTYWYHSHNMGQYPDGFRGALIVHDPNPPFQFDEEITITLSDWYHDQMPDLLAQYESAENEAAFGGREPVPNSALINDSNNSKIKVLPNKTYLVHIICLSNWPGHTWVFDGHEMTVVEVDGVYTEPYAVGSKMLRLAPAQRTSVLIKAKPDTSKNFAIWDTMDVNMMFVYEGREVPANYNPNVTAWFVYDEAKPLPPPPVLTEFEFVDDLTFIPQDKEALLQPMHRQIIIDTFSTEIDGVPRFTINNQTYIPPKVPTLYTANTVGKEYASDPAVYGQVNPFVVQHGEIVEIVINNHHNNLHPWHLHGHQFQVLQRSEINGGYFTGAYFQNISKTPIRRDTIMVQNHGHVPHRGNAAGKAGTDLSGANVKVPTSNHGAMYPPESEAPFPAPAPSSTSTAPGPEVQTPPPQQQQSPPPHQETPPPYSQPQPETTPGPKPTGHGKPPNYTQYPQPDYSALPYHDIAPVPAVPEVPVEPQPQPQTQTQPEVPAPESEPEELAPGYSVPEGQEPGPEDQPAYYEVAPEYYASQTPPQDEPITAQEQESKGLWPKPHTDSDHAQTGDGSDGRPPTTAHSEDTKGPWPNPHTDHSHAQVPDGPDGKPVVAHTDDNKGPWPNAHTNDQYVEEDGHSIKPAEDNGPSHLPKGYEYWEKYTN